MNILYYDESTPANNLYDLWEALKPQFPEGELLFLPNSVKLFMDVPAERLFSASDQIWVALEKIKEERPEEYQQAYQNRMIILRDKQWKEALNKANKKHKKKKCVCDECTVINCPNYDENRTEKCEWFSKNPGGI